MSNGSVNDVIRHVNGPVHVERLKDAQISPNISSFFDGQRPSLSSQVMSAELALAQFIALHKLPFQVADHMSSLFTTMFPDSRIAAGFAC